jgi:hypothetical protein
MDYFLSLFHDDVHYLNVHDLVYCRNGIEMAFSKQEDLGIKITSMWAVCRSEW